MAAGTSTQTGIRLQLLGEPKLDLGGEAFPLERKDAALLALLAVDGATTRGKAAALLWPDVDDDAARNSLRQRLHRLRRRAGRDVAVTTADVLRLADGVSHDLSNATELLAQDAGSVAGELLGSLDYADCEQLDEWLRAARERWRGTRRNALAEIAAKLEREGHIALALQYSERLLADDPLREHAHRQLMRLHYLRGDRAAALAVFERCRELLQRELGTTAGNETLELAALIESSGTLPSPAVVAKLVSVLRPPKLVGRDAEWSELEIAWQQKRFALVCGEPGIGKTRLLGDFVARHDGAIIVGARPGDARVPFALLARLLRAVMQRYALTLEDWARAELSRLLPELGVVPESKLQPIRLQRAVANALLTAGKAGLTACALDDLHFADVASIEAVLALIAAQDADVRWLVGVRTAEIPPRLLEWLAHAEADNIARIELGPLDVAAIETLLASLSLPDFDAHAWAEPLARHTGGNPLFILETLRTVLDGANGPVAVGSAKLPAPASIRQSIERRLQLLSPSAIKLARLAAIAGQDFSAELSAEVLRQHPLDIANAWRELENAHVIHDNAFAHDLILEAVHKSVPHPIALLMHRDIAAHLESIGGESARVARHWAEAQEWTKAGAQFRAAAQQAHELSQRQEEAWLLEQSVDCFERAGDRERAFEGMSALVIPSVVVAASRMPLDWIDRLLALASNDQERAEALRLKAIVHQARGEYTVVIDTMRQVIDIALKFEDRRPSCAATGTMAVALATIGRGDEAVAAMAPFRAWVLAHQDEDARAEYFAELANVLDLCDRREESLEPLRLALSAAQKSGTVLHQIAILRILAHVSMYLGRFSDALRYGGTAIAARAALGEARGISFVTDMHLGWCLREQGRFGEAIVTLQAAIEAFNTGGILHWQAFAENLLAQVWLQLGQPARASKTLNELPSGIPPFIVALRHVARAQILFAGGSSAATEISQAQEIFSSGYGRSAFRLLIEIEAARVVGGLEGATRLAALADAARNTQNFGLCAHALARSAECRTTVDPAAAAAVARDSIQLLERFGSLGIYHAELWLIAHQAFAAAGETAEALQALRSGLDWINSTALPNVPDEYSESFLNRNPVNRAILTAASRWK